MQFTGVLSGICCKLYDDLVVDNSILNDSFARVSLRTILVATTALYLASDFWTCVAFSLVVGTTFLADPDAYTSHEQSFAAIVPLLLVVSWKHRTPPTLIDGIGILGGALLLAAEPHVFPEETSGMKMISRIVSVVGLALLFMYLPRSANVYRMMSLWGIGYFGTSSVIQMLVLAGVIHISSPLSAKPQNQLAERIQEIRMQLNDRGLSLRQKKE